MQSDSGKLFIGGISWETKEEHLREYFGNYGEVVDVVIMKERNTGRGRGFGFVVFADPAVAQQVVLEKHLIDGRMVEAKKAVPRGDQQILNRNISSVHGSPCLASTKKIFVGGLPSTITESDFKKYFDQFGAITDVVVMHDHNTQRPRGFGFVTYDSENDVDKVLFKPFHELYGKMVEVKKAVPKELSAGTNVRSPAVTNGQNRMNNVINGCSRGYNPNSIDGYNTRMDSRLGLPTGVRNGFPSLGSGFGVGMNFGTNMLTSIGGNSSFSTNIRYERGFSPNYNGNSSRYSSPIGYGGVNTNTSSAFNSISGNSLGNGGLNYPTNATSPNSYMTSGSGRVSGFSNSYPNWGIASPMSARVGGDTSNYGSRNLIYGDGGNNFDLAGGSFGSKGCSSAAKAPLTLSSSGYEGNYAGQHVDNPVNKDLTWHSSSSLLQGTGPFAYGLGNASSDIIGSGSAGYVDNYSVTNRQLNRAKKGLKEKDWKDLTNWQATLCIGRRSQVNENDPCSADKCPN